MNKQEFYAAIAETTGFTQVDVAKVLNAGLDQIAATLAKGGEVVFTGFGSFKAKKRAARSGINPATKQAIKIPASVVPSFKAGKGLKDAVNK